ncbi:MAG: amidohydrolase family protein [Lentisphaeria bacterium]|nr:amidohydrolase family protein [Lentisphaeria bacterium]
MNNETDDTRIIRGGKVCDGSGTEPELKDLLIRGGRIAGIEAPGTFDALPGPRTDAAGKLVAPGFIDAHAHGDLRQLKYPENRTKLLQGITTEVDGNCGSSASCVPGESGPLQWRNLAEYADIINSLPVSTNTVALCGHNSLRRTVMGNRSDKVSGEELRRMRQLLEDACSAGAAGFTSGLTYFPGKFSDTAELTGLAEVLRGSEKIYATHMRSEGDTLLEAVQEAIEIAQAGSGRIEISHLKTAFKQNFHKIDALLDTLNRVRNDLDLHADRYPYLYSSTRIGQILPPPYDQIPDLGARLRESPEFRTEILASLKNSPRDLTTTILMRNGKTLAQLAEEQRCTVEEAAMQALLENTEQPAAYLCMSRENMMRILAQPWVCPGTDGISMQLDDPASSGHPRAVGTFPTFFRLVSGMTSVGEAIRRMTSLPASIFRIPERGLIREGYIADLVILDPDRYDSAAGFDGSNLMPSGVHEVIVSGKTAWSAAAPDKVGRFGRFLAID